MDKALVKFLVNELGYMKLLQLISEVCKDFGVTFEFKVNIQ